MANHNVREYKISVDCCLIDIYEVLKMYSVAFDIMKFMAEYNSWVYIPPASKALIWAREECRLSELSFEIEWRIEHNSNEIDVVEFKKYLTEIQEIEGSL